MSCQVFIPTPPIFIGYCDGIVGLGWIPLFLLTSSLSLSFVYLLNRLFWSVSRQFVLGNLYVFSQVAGPFESIRLALSGKTRNACSSKPLFKQSLALTILIMSMTVVIAGAIGNLVAVLTKDLVVVPKTFNDKAKIANYMTYDASKVLVDPNFIAAHLRKLRTPSRYVDSNCKSEEIAINFAQSLSGRDGLAVDGCDFFDGFRDSPSLQLMPTVFDPFLCYSLKYSEPRRCKAISMHTVQTNFGGNPDCMGGLVFLMNDLRIGESYFTVLTANVLNQGYGADSKASCEFALFVQTTVAPWPTDFEAEPVHCFEMLPTESGEYCGAFGDIIPQDNGEFHIPLFVSDLGDIRNLGIQDNTISECSGPEIYYKHKVILKVKQFTMRLGETIVPRQQGVFFGQFPISFRNCSGTTPLLYSNEENGEIQTLRGLPIGWIVLWLVIIVLFLLSFAPFIHYRLPSYEAELIKSYAFASDSSYLAQVDESWLFANTDTDTSLIQSLVAEKGVTTLEQAKRKSSAEIV